MNSQWEVMSSEDARSIHNGSIHNGRVEAYGQVSIECKEYSQSNAMSVEDASS